MCTWSSEICITSRVSRAHELGAAFAGGWGLFQAAEKLLKWLVSRLERRCIDSFFAYIPHALA